MAVLSTTTSLTLAAAPHSDKPDAASAPTNSGFEWDNAIIHIEVTSKAYNYIQPWQRSEKKVYKSGVVVEGHQIITTADGLADQTIIRLKKQGAGLFSLGRVAWIDYQANLAADHDRRVRFLDRPAGGETGRSRADLRSGTDPALER